jgi:hypothetical protein
MNIVKQLHAIKQFFWGKGTAVFVALAMLSFMLVPWISFRYRPYFAYYNGSDEQLYLSYQGGLALLDSRTRWLSSRLVVAWHEAGLSGAALNLTMDLISPIVMLGLMAFLLKRIWQIGNPWTGAWLIIFGSCLFNQANPLLEGMMPDFRYSQTYWISAFEGFATYIRSPEPQLSLLVALLVWTLFWRTKWWILLLLPAPLLYDSVLMPYGYLVSVYLARHWLPLWRSPSREILLNLSVLTLLSVSIGIVDSWGFFNALADLPTHYRQTHLPALSLSLLFAILVISVMLYRHYRLHTEWTAWDSSGLAIAFLQLFITNHTVISGVSIFPQALQSVGGTFGAAFLLFYLLQLIPGRNNVLRGLSAALVGIWILWSINNSQGLQLANNRYRLQLFHDISEQNLKAFRANPLGYVDGTQHFKGYIALAYPKQLMPLMAHSYNFPFFMSSCEPLAGFHKQALQFISSHLDDPQLAPHLSNVKTEQAAILEAIDNIDSYRDRCPSGLPESISFQIFPVQDDTMVLIKLIPPRITRQGVDF